MSWYIVKHKGDKRWTAYELSKRAAANLRKDITIKGPYNTLIGAWVASDRIENEEKVLTR